jgi:Spy/CpxP family protein refolding chaperone
MKATTMFRIFSSLMVAGALSTATIAPAWAEWHGAGGPGGVGGGLMLGVPLRSLNLTADQQSQIRSILSASRSANLPVFDQLRQAQNALSDALIASPTADVSSQIAAISGLRSQLLQSGVKTTQQMLAVLTPAQLSQALQVKAQLSQLRAQIRQLVAPSNP